MRRVAGPRPPIPPALPTPGYHSGRHSYSSQRLGRGAVALCHRGGAGLQVVGRVVVAAGCRQPRQARSAAARGCRRARRRATHAAGAAAASATTSRSALKWETEARGRLRAAIRRYSKPLADLVARDANEGDTRLLVTSIRTFHHWLRPSG
jgi:hypothetical protein